MFHYFIKPLTLGVCFGLFHGIICIPLACYYFGPESVADIMRDNKAINGGVQANNATERKNSKDIDGVEIISARNASNFHDGFNENGFIIRKAIRERFGDDDISEL